MTIPSLVISTTLPLVMAVLRLLWPTLALRCPLRFRVGSWSWPSITPKLQMAAAAVYRAMMMTENLANWHCYFYYYWLVCYGVWRLVCISFGFCWRGLCFSAFIHGGGHFERKKGDLSLWHGFAELQDGICVALDCISNRRQWKMCDVRCPFVNSSHCIDLWGGVSLPVNSVVKSNYCGAGMGNREPEWGGRKGCEELPDL